MTRTSVAAAAVNLRAGLSDLVGLAALAASTAVMWVSAWFAWSTVFVLALVVGVLADVRGQRRTPKLFEVFEASRLGTAERQIARDAALVLLIWRIGRLGTATVAGLAIGIAAGYLILGTFLLLRFYVARLRALPIETRNVDLSELGISDAIRPAALQRDTWLTAAWGVAALSVLVAGITGRTVIGLTGVVAAATIELIALAALALVLGRSAQLRNRRRVFEATLAAISRHQPEVVLYHSGAPGSAYQVNMWLSTLERLDRRAMVLLRQPELLGQIESTPLPVACVASASDVMDFEIASLKLALYVGNVGDNIHLIRNGLLRHVFIGHGDSDKAASANRVSRIYDQVWVAGPAGRTRYRRADARVDDTAVVEVGRPQLDGLKPAERRPDGTLTVLYAPTWEGWSGDMDLTSVASLGPALVRLLVATPGIRVIYRPHPLAGTRSPAVRHAHQRIVDLLAVPGTGRNATNRRPIRSTRRGADAAERSRDAIGGLRWLATQRVEQAEMERRFWNAHKGHSVVDGHGPGLYSCFDQADLLISDVSSITSDFIVTGKPFVVTNPHELPADEFLARYPSAAGGYLLGGTDQLAAIVADLRTSGPDRLAEERARAREQLLGPSEPDAITRFNAAVESLIAAPALAEPVAVPRPRGAAQSAAMARRL